MVLTFPSRFYYLFVGRKSPTGIPIDSHHFTTRRKALELSVGLKIRLWRPLFFAHKLVDIDVIIKT